MFSISEWTPAVIVLIVFAVLLVSSVTDIAWHRIPNLLLIPALLAALMLRFAVNGLDGLVSALGGLAVGTAFLLPLYVLGGMGAGDAKLLGVIGAYLGPWPTLIAGMFTLIAGAVLGLLFILGQRMLPMLVGQLQQHRAEDNLAAGHALIAAGTATPNQCFAYAPAIAVGSVMAMWQQDFFSFLVQS